MSIYFHEGPLGTSTLINFYQKSHAENSSKLTQPSPHDEEMYHLTRMKYHLIKNIYDKFSIL